MVPRFHGGSVNGTRVTLAQTIPQITAPFLAMHNHRAAIDMVHVNAIVCGGCMQTGYCHFARVVDFASHGHVPPFFEADGAIVVRVYFGEEVVEAAVGDRESSATQRNAQFVSRYFAVAVVVDGVEQREEFLFCLLDKGAKF